MPQSLLNKLIKNTKKHNDPLTPLIDQYLLKRDSSPNRYWGVPAPVEDRVRPVGRLSPSSICGCPRQAAFKFIGIKGQKLLDPESEIVFDDGKWRHLRLGWMCRDMEAVLGRDVFRVISIEEDVKFSDLMIAGSLDITVAIYGVPYVIDFKGVNHMGFEWLFNKGEPKIEHVRQITGYERLRKIKRGFIWYENKNDGRYLIFVVDYSPKVWREIKEWCQDVLDQMSREQLPLRHPECRDGRFLYGKCPYSRICYGNKTEAKIERLAYQNFPGVDAQWRKGLRHAEEQG